jgi:nitrite reductase (NO-forming)
VQVEKGKRVYVQTCSVCHQPEGQGLPNVFPPLAKSDFLMADKARSIGVVLKGLTGTVVVNGAKFDGVMPPQVTLSDEQIAHVLTFVRHSWGNTGDVVSVDEVKRIREERN